MGRGFWTLILAAFVNRLGTMVGPFLALYLVRERKLDDATVATLLALGMSVAIVGSFVGGWAADRLGRRPSLILGMAGNAAALLLIPWAPSLAWLVPILLLRTFTNDLPRPATNAAIADLVRPEDQRRAFGVYRTAVNLGFCVGTLMGGLLAVESFRWLFVIDASTGFASALVLLLFFRETRPAGRAESRPAGGGEGRAPAGRAESPAPISSPVVASADEDRARARAAWRFAGFCAVGLVVVMVSSQLETNLPMSLSRRSPGPDIVRTYGLLLAMNGLLVTLLQLPLSIALERARIGRAMALGAVLYGAGYGLVGLSLETGPLALAILLVTAGEMLFFPLGSVLTARLAPEDARGRWFGYLIMSYGVGRTLSPIAGNLLVERWGDAALWAASPPLGLLAAGGLLLLGRGIDGESKQGESDPPKTGTTATTTTSTAEPAAPIPEPARKAA